MTEMSDPEPEEYYYSHWQALATRNNLIASASGLLPLAVGPGVLTEWMRANAPRHSAGS